MADEHVLAPVQIARRVFVIAPDRDERASHVAMEMLLTLVNNDYLKPADAALLVAPKRRNGALRSLAIGENFLEGYTDRAFGEVTVEELGARLARGADFAGSDGLGLVQHALQALIDPRTRQGSAGALLLQPFHEALLWYDARRSGTTVVWRVRKVYMRGTGVALARVLLDPPAYMDAGERDLAAQAVDGVRASLQAPSPYGEIGMRLSRAIPERMEDISTEPDEIAAWRSSDNPVIAPLARKLVTHAASIMSQASIGPAGKLTQLRSIIALDIAHYVLTRSWEITDTPDRQQYLLASHTPEERSRNPVRVASEACYRSARLKVSQALVAGLAAAMQELAGGERPPNWGQCFEPRSSLHHVVATLTADGLSANFQREAEKAFEASGGGYGRPAVALRVLLESVDLVIGTGQYRYLRLGPDLLASVVGALASSLPCPADVFLRRMHDEWRIVVGEAEAVVTTLVDDIDGAALRRNARMLEVTLVDSGLAVALSDQTCMVGVARAEAS